MYQLIISAITHGLHYHTLNTMINNSLSSIYDDDYYKSDIININKATKNRIFYNLTVTRNKCFLKYKIINYEGTYTDMVKLVSDAIIDDYEILKMMNVTILNFNNSFIKELNTKKLDITLMPNFENINCIINKSDLLCFLFNFFKKLTMLKIINISFDINNYEDLYNFFIKEEMYILANIMNDVFYLNKEKIKYDFKKDKTYKKLVDYSFVLVKIQ